MFECRVRTLAVACLILLLFGIIFIGLLGFGRDESPLFASASGPSHSLHQANLEAVRTVLDHYFRDLTWYQWVRPATDLRVVLALGVLGLILVAVGLSISSRVQPGADAVAHEEADRPAPRPQRSELWLALRSVRGAFFWTAAFSMIINVLMLTGAIFMLEVYDRVLPSHSIPTLIGMCLIAGILFAAMGFLDLIRNRLLVRASAAIENSLAARVFDVVVRLPVVAGTRGDGLQPIRDLDAIRSFLSGPGPTALFDLPWLPFYIWIVYLFHPWLGMTALGGAIILICLTLLTGALARRPMRETTRHSMKSWCARGGLPAECRGAGWNGVRLAPGEPLAREQRSCPRLPARCQ